MSKLNPTLPLNGFAKEWPDFAVKEHYAGELISLACTLGQETAFAAAFKKTYGSAPPEPNVMAKIKGGFAVWSGQSQYLLLLNGENIQADIDAAAGLNGTAYATLQSDGWASMDVTGAQVFNVLERFIPLDLRRAPSGFAARTNAHHIAVFVLKFSETEIQFLTPRSSAQSLLDCLLYTTESALSA